MNVYIKNNLLVGIVCLFFYFSPVSCLNSRSREYHIILEAFLKKSNLLSPDVKKACNEYPEFYYQMCFDILPLVLYASMRPDIEDLQEIEKHIENQTLQMADIVLVMWCSVCYGEATMYQNRLCCLPFEPTDNGETNDVNSVYKQPDFKCTLCRIHNVLRNLANHMSWSINKSDSEIAYFDNQVIHYLKESTMNSLVLSSKFNTISSENNK